MSHRGYKIIAEETYDQTAELDLQRALAEPIEFWKDTDNIRVHYIIWQDGVYRGASLYAKKYTAELDTRNGIIMSYREPYAVVSDQMRAKLEKYYSQMFDKDVKVSKRS